MAWSSRKLGIVPTATWMVVFLWMLTVADAGHYSTTSKSFQKHPCNSGGELVHHTFWTRMDQRGKRGQAQGNKYHVKQCKVRTQLGAKVIAKIKTRTKARINHGFVAMGEGSCGPGQPTLCPPENPCCSQWGFCGIGSEYCQGGCQPAYGKCGDNVQVGAAGGGDGRRRRLQHGFDLQERRRRYPKYDGGVYRIPSTVSKLPSPGTLVNIGYYPGWIQYRGQGRNHCHQRPYLPLSIPWASLDYVMFAFVYFDEAYQLYPADANDEPLYFEIQKRKLATRTRVMISIGGWSFTHPDSWKDQGRQHLFETMIRSGSSRRMFIESCIEFCQFFGFDGVDIDYEYPSYQDREFMTALFKEMRVAFDAEGSGLVLSMAGASFQEGVRGYELDKVAENVDFIMIMTYDLYGAFDSNHIVNLHTALVQMPTETHRGHSVQGAVELYLDLGVPRQKIVLGLALYGKSFVLAEPWHSQQPGVAKFSAGGDPSSCLETRGNIAYNEIANLVRRQHQQQQQQQQQQPAFLPRWDPYGRAFYFVYGDRQDNWVGYDDRPSLDLKLQLVTELNLAGVMWWSLDQDLDPTSEELEVSLQMQRLLQRRGIPQVPFRGPYGKVVEVDVKANPEHSLSSRLSTSVTTGSGFTAQTSLQMTVYTLPISSSSSSLSIPSPTASLDSTTQITLTTEGYASYSGCPTIVKSPPAWMVEIPLEVLGKPGLIPYVASKRKRCPMVMATTAQSRHSIALPETPVRNVVLTRCPGPSHCMESWQAFTCRPDHGWSRGSPCYAKGQLSPALYFYGDLELVRSSARDQETDFNGAMTESALDGVIELIEPLTRSTVFNKMSAQIGTKCPQYIARYLKLSKLEQHLTKVKGTKMSKRKKVMIMMKMKMKGKSQGTLGFRVLNRRNEKQAKGDEEEKPQER